MPADRKGSIVAGGAGADQAQRLDKWLWYARVAKSRSLAAALIERGKIRVNRVRTQKPSHTVKPGDVITASVGRSVRVLKVVEPGQRRGPASEAQTLYEDLTPINEPLTGLARQVGGGDEGGAFTVPASNLPSARPNKKERRQIVRMKGRDQR
ncbi:MAG: RNA-binding S4 domain-containing protein [Filomicrobium sp.]